MVKRRGKKRLRRNELSKSTKLLAVGGVAVVGGVAAYALLGGGGGGPPPGPSAPPTPGGADKAQECAALQQSLQAMRAMPRPDPAQMLRLEQQIAVCIRQAQEMGGEVDPAIAQASTGDQLYARINQWFDEYRNTDYADLLKRNNIRQEMLRAGQQMAEAYAQAVTQSASDDTTSAARVAIARALESAIQRRLCYLYDQRGCGRLGVNEDHGNDKAAQEQARTIDPLMAAHTAAVAKLGGPGRMRRGAGTDVYLNALLLVATAAKDYADAKFNEYKSVDYADVVRRNNLRQEVLTAARSNVAALREAFAAAQAYRSGPAMKAAAVATVAALESSSLRWFCYLSDQPGCGRLGLNEDHGNDKAAQERTAAMLPLSELFPQIGQHLVVSYYDYAAFDPFVALKIRIAGLLNDFAASKFNEYKSVDYSDAVRRNNLRQVVLAAGRDLVALLDQAFVATMVGATARPSVAAQVAGTRLLGSGLTFSILPTGTSGLGVTLAPSLLTSSLLTKAAPTAPMPAPAATGPTPQELTLKAGVRNVKMLSGMMVTALDASVNRMICYQTGASGCGRFGVNEDEDATKASQERAATVAPLIGLCDRSAKFLVANGDPRAEEPLVRVRLKICNVLDAFMNAKFSELKSVDYIDGLRRTNIRNEILRAGRDLVRCYSEIRPVSTAGSELVRAAMRQSLTRSQERKACYQSGNGCDRIDDAGYGAAVFFSGGTYAAGGREADRATKVAEEESQIERPLATLIAKPSLAGLGEDSGGLSMEAWLGIGAAAVLVGSAMLRSGRMQRNRVRAGRRTSRKTRIK